MSVSTSPLSIRKRSSSRSSAYLSAPAVPRGSGSSMKRRRRPYCEPSPRTLRTAVARNPHDMTTSSTPWPRSHSSMYAMNGRSTSGTTGLGTVEVSGRRRVPSPPTRITACIDLASRSSDALVDEPGRANRVGVERVAPVDDDVAGHRRGHRVPVERAEDLPLGHEHGGVRAAHGRDRIVGEGDPAHELARLRLGHRVVRADARAGGLEAGAEDERGRLPHVVRLGLEREPEERDLLVDERAAALLVLGDDAPPLELGDLDDRVEELEVVARVAGELLEGRYILRKTIIYR